MIKISECTVFNFFFFIIQDLTEIINLIVNLIFFIRLNFLKGSDFYLGKDIVKIFRKT